MWETVVRHRRLLRNCLAIGAAVTVLSSVVAWNPNPGLGRSRLWRGAPCAAIHPGSAHGASIKLTSRRVRAPLRPIRGHYFESMLYASQMIDIVLDVPVLLLDLLFWSGLALLLATRPRMARNSLLCAVAVTALSCTFASEFCIDGASRGLPFAITHPHRSAVPAMGIRLPSKEKYLVFDLLSLLRDLLVWSGIALAVLAGREFAKVRKARRLARGAAVGCGPAAGAGSPAPGTPP
jgi:hypothetical protein